ncbi:MAG: hypothetical protein DRZ82_07020 [Thermoprotei archaeon]|nr:MAG: hypothetical protein DRZ82_07020 [Thermoprotei archaeon]
MSSTSEILSGISVRRRVVFKCSICGKEIYEEGVPFTFYKGEPLCIDCYIKNLRHSEGESKNVRQIEDSEK